MFYHQGILQKRGGKFGIIWLAATRIEHLKRRELCEVNLQKTCDDIIDHILVRVQAKTPGKKRTRFSLYLSSQLLYGATRVLAKQSDFLFSDASTFFTRVRMAIAADAEAEIDLKGIFRCETVTIPDMATIDSPGRPGFDPTFGLMRMGSSEAKITYPELEMWRVNSSMVIPGSPYLSPIPKRRGSSPASKDSSHVIQPELGSPHTVSSKDEITIREEEIQIPDIEVPGEKDLPTFDGKELDMILEEPLDPNINWMNILSPVVPEPPKETTLDQMAQEQGTLSPKEQTPFSRPDGELPQRRDMALSPGVTPIPKMTPVQAQRMRPSLTMQLTPVAPSPVRRRRRRRRQLCIDQNTQISKEQLRNNMKTGADTCLPLVLPDPQNSTVKDLFSRPGKKALNHPSILPLWESNTKYGISETDSDRGIPVWSVPDLHLQEEEPRSRKRLRISTPPIEKLASPPQKVRQDVTMETSLLPEVAQDMPSIEIPRDTSISMERSRHGDVTPVSLHHSRSLLSDVDKSKDSFTDEPSAKRSRSSRKTRSRGGTSSEDDLADITARAPSEVSFPTREDVSVAGNLSIVQEEEMHVSRLQDIPAMVAEPQLSHHRDILIRTIDRLDREDTPTTFQHICPPLSSSRKMAAKMFSTLLELCAGNKLEVEQYHSYDDIYITKGQNW